jgi:hypothetical protein
LIARATLCVRRVTASISEAAFEAREFSLIKQRCSCGGNAACLRRRRSRAGPTILIPLYRRFCHVQYWLSGQFCFPAAAIRLSDHPHARETQCCRAKESM